MHSSRSFLLRNKRGKTKTRKKFYSFSEYKFSPYLFFPQVPGHLPFEGGRITFCDNQIPVFSRSEMEPLLGDRSNIRSSPRYEKLISIFMVGLGFVQKKIRRSKWNKRNGKRGGEKKSQMVHFKNDKGFIT